MLFVKKSEFRILLSLGAPSTGLYREAMKSLRDQARIAYGKNIGFVNITKDELYEAVATPFPFLHVFPLPFFSRKTIILSADIIRYTD